MEVVENIYFTFSPCNPEYIFQIELSTCGMRKLKTKKVLGMEFQKEKYEFLSDLADVLAKEILEHLERIE